MKALLSTLLFLALALVAPAAVASGSPIDGEAAASAGYGALAFVLLLVAVVAWLLYRRKARRASDTGRGRPGGGDNGDFRPPVQPQ